MKIRLCLSILLFPALVSAINTYPPDGSSGISSASDLGTPPDYPPANPNPLDVIQQKEMEKNQGPAQPNQNQDEDSEPALNPQLDPEVDMPPPTSE